MKFRRLACGCCKSSDFPSLCKYPTYVMSEVVESSNVIFLLMSKRGRTSCIVPLADREPAVGGPQDAPCEHDLPEPADVVWSGRRAEDILAACWRPSYRLPRNDDFKPGESPIRRNQRLLEEDSGFWPRRRADREADAALRECE